MSKKNQGNTAPVAPTAPSAPLPGSTSLPVMTKTLVELKSDMVKAVDSGDYAAVQRIGRQMASMGGEEVKKDTERHAAAREQLAAIIWNDISGKYKEQIATVKALGFVFKMDTSETQYKAVQLIVPSSKGNHVGGKGNKTVSEYGMRLGEVFDKFATADEKASIDGKARNQVNDIKIKVLKRVVASGELKPIAAK